MTRSCIHCSNQYICSIFQDVKKAVYGKGHILNVDAPTKKTKKTISDILKTVANACIKFEFDHE